MTIEVRTSDGSVQISRESFELLFENSVVRDYAAVRDALKNGYVAHADLVERARQAEIPWCLFFAPEEVVATQVRLKREKLLQGIEKDTLALNSRSRVRLADVELIVKDLMRKQEHLKRLDKSLQRNQVTGCLRQKDLTVVQSADRLRGRLGIDLGELHACTKKELAFDLAVQRFEENQVYVSTSQRGYMLQEPPQKVKFSGLCVRDSKIPFIFLASGDEKSGLEPAGRRLFTMTLLAVMIGFRKFAPLTFNDAAGGLILRREYEIAEEVLMPARQVAQLSVPDRDAVDQHAERFKVTPSAFVMRALRLKLLLESEAEALLDDLRREFGGRPKSHGPRRPRPENAVRRYSGAEYVRRMSRQVDLGTLPLPEFRRVVCLNKLEGHQIAALRASVA